MSWKTQLNKEGDGELKKTERWPMYIKIQELKKLGLHVSQIARHLRVSRNTVYKYIDMEPDEFNKIMEDMGTRSKKLDNYQSIILKWLKTFPDISAAQIYDWLEEKYGSLNICEGTVRNYVNELRDKNNIPKELQQRSYESINDPPMGYQMQVDFGETKLTDTDNNLIKLHFITFVLSNSRYKYVEWLDRPFTTSEVIRCHENAFSYFGGIPEEVVYDQDSLILVRENYGDLIFTKAFASYQNNRSFRIYMCRKGDPESKGRIENVVGYVKKSFAKHRLYYNLEKLNEQCLLWLERRGNGKIHNTTKKIPAQVFALERQHLKPVNSKINTTKTTTNSIARTVRKDNTVIYLSNRYSLPLGTYKSNDRQVHLTIAEDNLMVITDSITHEVLAKHQLCQGKGQLIKDSSHARDKTQGIDSFMKVILTMLGDSQDAQDYLQNLRKLRSRYIRDQLQLLKQTILNQPKDLVSKALNYCVKNKLYSAVYFRDALTHFSTQNQPAKLLESDDKPLAAENLDKIKSKPRVRDVKVYQDIMNGGCHGAEYSSTNETA